MKQLYAFFVGLLLSATLLAHPVDQNQARRVAVEFLQGKDCAVTQLTDITFATPFREFYLFTFQTPVEGVACEGFILVAGDDCVLPVLAYSTTQPFRVDGMPAHIHDWLQGYEEEIAYCRQHAKVGDTPQPPVWNSAVAPLLTTTWAQGNYYNSQCPYDNVQGGASVTGCVATATAQIMKYWNHPATGYGSHSYSTTNCGPQSADFGATTYDWVHMPNSLTAYSSSTQLNAVGTLMYHIGVAVEMEYRNSSSSATTTGGNLGDVTAENALKIYFKYSPTLHSVRRADCSNSQWCALLRAELDSLRPVLYTGRDTSGGHAFVLDGYNNSGQFHVNWGWGGYCDGYYTMGSLNPASGGTGGNSSHSYNLKNAAVIGIRPNTAFNTSAVTTVVANTNNSAFGTVTGSNSYGFGDTVMLRATAAEGCRFNQWNDGSKDNPRQFIAMGGSYSFTAQFEMLSGDTLSYCTGNTFKTSLGSSSASTKRWGVKFPASVLTAGHDLEEVQLYVRNAGTYTLTVYVGGISNSAIQYTETYSISSADAQAWNTFTLGTPVPITGTQPLWVTFQSSDVSYPAAMTYNSGNDDALLWASSYNSISSNWDYSWMIRAIFASSNVVPQREVQIVCEGDGSGWVDTVMDREQYLTLCGQQLVYDDSSQVHIYADVFTGSFIDHFYVNETDMINELYYPIYDGSMAQYSFLATEDVTVRVVFALESYQIIGDAEPSFAGSVTGGGVYHWHDSVTLTAVPYEGFRFVSWHDGNTDNPRTVIVTDTKRYVAHFEKGVGIAPVTSEALAVCMTPNPASDRVVLTVEHLTAEAVVSLVDLGGRTLLQRNLPAGGGPVTTLSLPLQGLQPGVYLVRFVSENRQWLGKLLVK